MDKVDEMRRKLLGLPTREEEAKRLALALYVTSGVMTPNEARRALCLDALATKP